MAFARDGHIARDLIANQRPVKPVLVVRDEEVVVVVRKPHVLVQRTCDRDHLVPIVQRFLQMLDRLLLVLLVATCSISLQSHRTAQFLS